MEKISKKEFTYLYKKTRTATLPKLLKLRKHLIGKIIHVVLLGTVLIFAALVMYFQYNWKIGENYIQMFSTVYVGLSVLYIQSSFKHFKSSYKRRMIRPMVEGTFKNFTYQAKSKYSLEEFNSSKLFTLSANMLIAEDEISGTVGNRSFSMVEVRAKQRSSGHSRHATKIFSGFLFRFEFNKNFSTHTVIRPDLAEQVLGNFLGQKLQSISFGKLELIKLEDPEFEKLYVVYGESQQEARYLLSTSLMQRILKIRKKFKSPCSFAFIDNQLLISLPRSRNYFEPDLFGSLANYRDFQQIYTMISEIEFLTGELGLNTTIWKS